VDRQVVVIDVEPDVLDMICDALELEGLSVLCLERPEEAEALHAEVDASLFLIDIMLPGTCGIELARGLRDDGFPHTPMIAMSASERMIASARRTGLFQETLSKPFHLDELLDAVARHAG
jgi:DNA-binding response OmpR family regulator